MTNQSRHEETFRAVCSSRLTLGVETSTKRLCETRKTDGPTGQGLGQVRHGTLDQESTRFLVDKLFELRREENTRFWTVFGILSIANSVLINAAVKEGSDPVK